MTRARVLTTLLALSFFTAALGPAAPAWCAPAGITVTGAESCCCPGTGAGTCAMRCAKPVPSPRIAAAVPHAPNHTAAWLSAGADAMFGTSPVSALSLAALSERASARPSKRYLLACNLRL